jgi:predicted Zn-dependent protease
VLSRYRAPLLATLLPLAGAGAVVLSGWVAARRWPPLLVTGLASALFLAWATGDPPRLGPAVRAATYRREGEAFSLASPALGALYLQEALRLEPGTPAHQEQLGRLLLAAGDPEGALPHLEAGRAGDRPSVRVLRARALAELGRPTDALSEVRAALAAEPGVAGGQALLDLLEGAPGPARGVTSRGDSP